jgi:hypothetical protein
MGASGYRTFDDDTACDWLGAFLKRPALATIESTIEAALGPGFLDDRAGAHALAAAEVVAALNGRPAARLDGEAAAWAAGQPRVGAELLSRARTAVARVLRESELRDIWLDAGSLAAWEAAVGELQSRLADG